MLAISSTGELAISLAPPLHVRLPIGRNAGARAARRRRAARGPRRRGGRRLVAGRRRTSPSRASSGNRGRVEYPIGKVLYDTAGWVEQRPRLAGRAPRRLHRPPAEGRQQRQSEGHRREREGPAERPVRHPRRSPGRRAGTRSGRATAAGISATSLDGKSRSVWLAPGGGIADIARDGRILCVHELLATRDGRAGSGREGRAQPDLAQLVLSRSTSPPTAGPSSSTSRTSSPMGIYLRKLDGSTAVRIGEGERARLLAGRHAGRSPSRSSENGQFTLLPTGAGEPKELPKTGIVCQSADVLPRRHAGSSSRATSRDTAPGSSSRTLRAASPAPSLPRESASSSRRLVPGRKIGRRRSGPDRRLAIYPIEPGEPRPLPGQEPDDVPLRWTPDGSAIFVYRPSAPPLRVETSTSRPASRTLWKELRPPDPSGVEQVGPIQISPDEKSYVYSYRRALDELYLATGTDRADEPRRRNAARPYEILAPLGAGGMGEVYRARDAQLGREVAIKVLPGATASDPDRRARFEQEARAASALNHPNILTIHDIGAADGTDLHRHGARRGQDPARARRRGRAAADEEAPRRRRPDRRGPGQGARRRHRAPGPEAREPDGLEGRLRQDPRLRPGQADRDRSRRTPRCCRPPIAAPTQPGTVMGTVGYMSPEQASGQPVDFRSDQFSLGSILYEMATGKRAFQRKTGAETLVAIIREEPEPISPARARRPRRPCAGSSSAASPRIPRSATPRPGPRAGPRRACATTCRRPPAPAGSRPPSPQGRRAAAGSCRRFSRSSLGAALGVAVEAAARRSKPARPDPVPAADVPARPDPVRAVRPRRPDDRLQRRLGGPQPVEIFTTRPDSAESRSLDLPGADGARGLLDRRDRRLAGPPLPHRLRGDGDARARAAGRGRAAGDPRERRRTPTGLPTARSWRSAASVGNREPGRVPDRQGPLRGGRLGQRASASRRTAGSLAFVDHAAARQQRRPPQDRGHGRQGAARRALRGGRRDARVVAARETRSGRAIGADPGNDVSRRQDPHRLDLPGADRSQDLSRDGRVLLLESTARREIVGLRPGDGAPHNLTRAQLVVSRATSPPTARPFSSTSRTASRPASTCASSTARPRSASADGEGYGFSPDGRWALTRASFPSGGRSSLVPTGAGESKTLRRRQHHLSPGRTGSRTESESSSTGSEAGTRRPASSSWTSPGGKPQADHSGRSHRSSLSPSPPTAGPSWPAGRTAGSRSIRPTPGEPRPVPGIEPEEIPLRWTPDGRSIYVTRLSALPGDHRHRGRRDRAPDEVEGVRASRPDRRRAGRPGDDLARRHDPTSIRTGACSATSSSRPE